MIAPKWRRVLHKLAYFSSRDPRKTHGYWAQCLNALRTWDPSVICSYSDRSVQSSLFAHPSPLSDGNLHPAALLRMRGNYFRPYLSIFACAIEVQNSNEISTIIQQRTKSFMANLSVFLDSHIKIHFIWHANLFIQPFLYYIVQRCSTWDILTIITSVVLRPFHQTISLSILQSGQTKASERFFRFLCFLIYGSE